MPPLLMYYRQWNTIAALFEVPMESVELSSASQVRCEGRDSLTAFLPFNIDCLNGQFVSAKAGGPPASLRPLANRSEPGLVMPDGPELALPVGDLPSALEELLPSTLAGKLAWYPLLDNQAG